MIAIGNWFGLAVAKVAEQAFSIYASINYAHPGAKWHDEEVQDTKSITSSVSWFVLTFLGLMSGMMLMPMTTLDRSDSYPGYAFLRFNAYVWIATYILPIAGALLGGCCSMVFLAVMLCTKQDDSDDDDDDDGGRTLEDIRARHQRKSKSKNDSRFCGGRCGQGRVMGIGIGLVGLGVGLVAVPLQVLSIMNIGIQFLLMIDIKLAFDFQFSYDIIAWSRLLNASLLWKFILEIAFGAGICLAGQIIVPVPRPPGQSQVPAAVVGLPVLAPIQLQSWEHQSSRE